MGPYILLDKSFLQALSTREISFLFKHYSIIIIPTLINEIIGDLKKGDNKKVNEEKVISLANRISPESDIFIDYKTICFNSLLGQFIPMDGTIINFGGKVYDTPKGKGIFKDEPPIMDTIRKWKKGDFSYKDEIYATSWRYLSKLMNFEKIKPYVLKIIKKSTVSIPKINNYKDLDFYVTETINSPEQQRFFINSIIDHIELSHSYKMLIINRWEKLGMPTIQQFSPYAYYCIKLRLLFSTGIISGLIGTRATNIIDLEYLFYLPFTWIFVSCDKFHKNLSQILLRDNQVYIDGTLLKEDLKNIITRWDSLSEEEKNDDAYNYGSYPPPNDDSITHEMWKKYMKPWKPASGNLVIKMTKEDEKKLLDKILPFIDSIKKQEDDKKAKGQC